MRLTLRLMAVLLLSILLLLAIDSYLIVRRDVQQYDRDTRRDAIQLGSILAEVAGDIWRDDGEAAARELVGRLSRGDESLLLRWVQLGASGSDAPPAGLSSADGAALRRGETVSFKARTASGEKARFTLVPLADNGPPGAALLISESLSEQAAQTRRTVYRSLILGGLVIVAGVVLLVSLGIHLIGRPLQQLVAKTERIGAGDLSGDLVIHGRDELSELAGAMNRMCENLAEAREEIRRENEARLRALDQLRHTERLSMLGRLSSGLAHELGTPLNVMAGRAKMIARRQLDSAEAADSARIIVAQADRMTDLVRRFLDYARRGASRPAPEDLKALASRSLAMLEPTAGTAGVTLTLEAPEDLPEVMVDRMQLEQVVVNLVMNAVQAMPEGGEVRVVLSAEPAGKVALQVIDTGVGIAAADLEQICEPFFTTKPVGEGTGLGLSIVKGIVEDNGGELAIESTPGQGTTVSVRLARKDAS